jgi:serine/threonine-protein kinase ATR
MHHFVSKVLSCSNKGNSGRGKTEASTLADQCFAMTAALLELCNLVVKDGTTSLSIAQHAPMFTKLVPSRLIVPLQESIVVTLPPTSSQDVLHKPFPQMSPTIQGIKSLF